MAENIKAATLEVPVESDTRGFSKELKAKIEKAAAGIKAVIGVEVSDKDRLRDDVKRAAERAGAGVNADIGVEVNARALRQRLIAAVKHAEAGLSAEIGTTVDSTGLRRKLAAATELAEKGINADIGTNVRSAGLRERLRMAVENAARGLTAQVGVIFRRNRLGSSDGEGTGGGGAGGDGGQDGRAGWLARRRARRAARAGDDDDSGPGFFRRMMGGVGRAIVLPVRVVTAPVRAFRDRRRAAAGGGDDGGSAIDASLARSARRYSLSTRLARGALGMITRLTLMLGIVTPLVGGLVGGLAGLVPLIATFANAFRTFAVLPLTISGALVGIGALLVAFSGITGELEDMPKPMADVRREVETLADEWNTLRERVQTDFWTPIAGKVKEAGEVALPALSEAYSDFVKELGNTGAALAQWLSTDEFVKETEVIGGHTATLAVGLRQMLFGVNSEFDDVTENTQGLVQYFGDLMAATGPLQDRMAGALSDFGQWAGGLLDTEDEVRDFQKRMEGAADSISQWGRIIGDVWSGLGGLFRGAMDSTGDLTTELEKLVDRWSRWTNSEEGQQRITDFFETVEPLAREVGGLLGDIVKELLSLAEDPQLTSLIREIRNDLLPSLSEFIQGIAQNVGPQVVDLITNVIEAFSLLSGDGSLLTPVLSTINGWLETLNNFLASHPDAAQKIGGVLGALLVLKGLTGSTGVISLLTGLFGAIGTVGGAGWRALSSGRGFRGIFGELFNRTMIVSFGGIPQPVYMMAGGAVPGGKPGAGGKPGQTPSRGRRALRVGGGLVGGLAGLAAMFFGSDIGDSVSESTGSDQAGGLLGGLLTGAGWGSIIGKGPLGALIGSAVGAKVGQYTSTDAQGRKETLASDTNGMRWANMIPMPGQFKLGAGASMGILDALLKDDSLGGKLPEGLRNGIDGLKRVLDPTGWALEQATAGNGKAAAKAAGKGGGISFKDMLTGPLSEEVQRALGPLSFWQSEAPKKAKADLTPEGRKTGESLVKALPQPIQAALAQLGIFQSDAPTKVKRDLSGEGRSTVQTLINALPAPVQAALAALGLFQTDAPKKVATDLKGEGTKTGKSLADSLPGPVQSALEAVGVFKTKAPGTARVSLTGEGGKTGKSLVDALPAPIQSALKAVGVFKSKAPDTARVSLAGEGGKTGKSLVDSLPKPIQSALKAVGVFKTKAPNSARADLKGSGQHATKTLASPLSGGVSKALGVLSKFRKSAPRSASVSLWGVGSSIISSLRQGLESGYQRIKNSLSTLTSKIPQWKGPADVDSRLLTPAGESIINSLLPGFAKGMPRVRAALGALTREIGDTSFLASADLSVLGSGRSRLLGAGSGDTSVVFQPGSVLVQNPVPEPVSDSLVNVMRKATEFGLEPE